MSTLHVLRSSKSRSIVLKIFVALVLPLMAAQGCGSDSKASQEEARSYPEHFWDNVNTAVMSDDEREQRLVDYMYLSMSAAPEQRRRCWQTIARVFPDEQPNRLVADYLGEPGSPLYAPEMLEEYLEAIAELFDDGSLQRIRIDYLLDGIRKNKAGQQIADLDLVTAAGRHTTLHTLIAGSNAGSNVLLYDPGCEECAALIGRLAADADAGNVVAVSVTGKARELPQAWHSCTVADPEQLDERFYLPRLPQLYTVDSCLVIRP